MPGVTIIPIGLFDGKQQWEPNYEQWRGSKVCFVDDIQGVKETSRYDGFPDMREFERVWKASSAGEWLVDSSQHDNLR
jgi:hypothetical protein